MRMQLCRTKFRKSSILLAKNWNVFPRKKSSQIDEKIWTDHELPRSIICCCEASKPASRQGSKTACWQAGVG